MTILEHGWFTTCSGLSFNPIEPTVDMIELDDIAHALSNVCRFGGHSSEFYSVAQHSIIVADYCLQENKKHGLLHDASEAYISDIVRPLKRTDEMKLYREVEDNLMHVIYDKFGLEHEYDPEVKYWDLVVLRTEMRDVTNFNELYISWEDSMYLPLKEKIIPWSPKESYESFMATAYDLGIK